MLFRSVAVCALGHLAPIFETPFTRSPEVVFQKFSDRPKNFLIFFHNAACAINDCPLGYRKSGNGKVDFPSKQPLQTLAFPEFRDQSLNSLHRERGTGLGTHRGEYHESREPVKTIPGHLPASVDKARPRALPSHSMTRRKAR